MRGKALLSFAALAMLSSPWLGAADPPAPTIKVLGPALEQSPTVPVVVLPGRFVPVAPTDGSPSYVAPNESFRLYKLPPGSAFVGVKFDAPPDAEPESYSWPDNKGTTYILLARNRVGVHRVQFVKNGPAESGPVENGAPFLIQIGTVPEPMPPPKPAPVPVPIPIVDPLFIPAQAAYTADLSPSKAADAIALAAVYRATAEAMPSIGTTDSLASVIETSRKARVGERLPTVRPLLGTDFAKTFPSAKGVALTPELKAEAVRQLTRYATILEGLK